MNFTRRDEIVIIGANTAGLSAALAVRRSGDSRPITILERKKYIGVARCSIPYLAGEDALKAEELIRRDPEKFSAENRLQIVTEAEVTGIEPSTRTVFYNHEDIQKDIEYSKLLLASGSVPVCPASFSAAGELLTAYDVEDLVRLNLSLKAGMKLAILGGGPIGIELAYQLARRGYEVTVFEMRNIIPPLSEKTSRQVVDQLAEAGVKVLEQTAVEEVQKISSGFNIRAAGNLHQFDLAIAALGFRPMSDFINDPELQKKEDGSIPVDRRMRSGLPDVYAAGDLVARPAAGRGHIRWPLASSASVDGWVAGMNIAGELEYRSPELCRMGFVLGDRSYARIGQFPLADNLNWYELQTAVNFEDTRRGIKDRLAVENDRVVAAEIAAGGNMAGMLLDPLAPCLLENPALKSIAQLEPVYHPGMNPVNSPLAIAARSALQSRDGG